MTTGGPSGGAGNPLAAVGSLPEPTRIWLGWGLKDELLAQERVPFSLVVLKTQSLYHL